MVARLESLLDDNTVRFGALDFDAKNLSESEVRAVLQCSVEHGLPLVWSRSRSGGLHGFLFLVQPLPAALVRRALRSMGAVLGWTEKKPGESKDRGDRFFEVFPKHDHLAPHVQGNWLRLPWPGADGAQARRGVWLLECPVTFTGWLAFAMQHRASRADLEPYATSAAASKPAMPDAQVAASRSSPAEPNEHAPARLSVSMPEVDVTLDAALQWLNALEASRADDYEQWVRVGMALHHQFAGSTDESGALAAWDSWSQQSRKYENGACERKWRSFSTDSARHEITIRSLRSWANKDASEQHIKDFNRRYAKVTAVANAVLYTPPDGRVEYMPSRHWKEIVANEQLEIPRVTCEPSR